MADVIVARNRGDKPFEVKFNSRITTIPAGGEAIIDREAAVVWFGDWEARNVGKAEMHQFRSQELARLKGLYGAHFDDRPGDPRTPEPLTADEKWVRYCPQIELYNTSNERIIGILDDPTGHSLPLEDAPSDVLAAAVNRMQSEMEDLKAQIAAANEAKATIDIPVDSSENSPQRRRGNVKVDAALEDADVG